MKKLVLFFAVAVAFASCGPKATQEEVVEPAIEVAPVVDETADTTVQVVVEEVVEVPAAQ